MKSIYMTSTYTKKQSVVDRQCEVLSKIYDLTQEAPPMIMQPTMDKNLDVIAQDIEELLFFLAETLDDKRSLWDEDFNR